MNDQIRVSEPTPKVPIWIIDAKVRTMITTIERVSMYEMGTAIVTTTTIKSTMATKLIGWSLCSSSKIDNLVLWRVGVVCHVLRI